MEKIISALIKTYKDYISANTEYNLVRWHLKDLFYDKSTKEETRRGIGYYDVFIKNKDHSYYKPEAIEYLQKQKLNNFIGYKLDFKKIKSFIPENIYLENLIDEKTMLTFSSPELVKELKIIKELARDRYMKLINQRGKIHDKQLNLVNRCDVLKNKSKNLKFDYNRLCYQLKNMMSTEGKSEMILDGIKFKIVVTGATFKPDFEKQLLNTDFSSPFIKNDKLKKSVSKKIDWDYLNQYKVENIKPYLYIKVFQSRLSTYNKKKGL
ncbi:MAG: hypothetical protein ACRCX2_33910 [Paraclostridium sp.]